MRLQSEQFSFNAPDGTDAIVVDNTPEAVVFYVPRGDHQGYYHHNKRTGENRIAAG